MKETVITVTEAARNSADCINRAHYQGVTFVLTKNGTPVARIVPEEKKRCSGAELAKVLRRVKLSEEEAAAWNRDLREARKMLKPPTNRWE